MRARAAAASLALVLVGCPLHPRAPDPRTGEGDWARVRDAATRRHELYDGLVHRATATATHLGPEVRQAQAERLARWLSWTDEELRRHLTEQAAEAARFEDFVLVLYTADRDDNDLDATRSIWRVAVETDGTAVLPGRITALEDESNLRGFFPWVGPFDVAYAVRFPRGAHPLEGRPFVLRLSSAVGQIPLDFGAPARPFTAPRLAP
jgi:hypothetical protein